MPPHLTIMEFNVRASDATDDLSDSASPNSMTVRVGSTVKKAVRWAAGQAAFKTVWEFLKESSP